jgi:voltage-gated potassium channel
MTSFFLTLMRLFSAIWRGKEDPELKALFLLLIVVLVSGVLFYTQVEGWSVIDAMYFAVITMSTIGYGDLSPETTFGKVFTMFYALLSVGIFVSLAAKIGSILLEKERQKTQKLAEKIRHDEKAT